ncbi:Proteasome subunit alpha type-2 [Thelohanellus kitauei]|uniref:Proteasome subunit alpha type n=1 Tax=Thelohanellus kitauei TaxID=669202 RepID=A0A0C2MHN1_THEKT|nr:Proteasome subunit alpha type-2 [Thelohanellus kitauei]
MSSERYSFSLTTFSPSGKLVQIEYALAAVSLGSATVGIKASNGVVLLSDKKQKSFLYDEGAIFKLEAINDTVVIGYSGLGPDFRLIVRKARKMASSYKLFYGVDISAHVLTQRLSNLMQEYTQSGGVRPFGISLLVVGIDDGKPVLFQCDPSGAYFAWNAAAIGRNQAAAKTFLSKRYKNDLELEDAIHLGIMTLKECVDGLITPENVEIAICSPTSGTKLLSRTSVKEYVDSAIA